LAAGTSEAGTLPAVFVREASQPMQSKATDANAAKRNTILIPAVTIRHQRAGRKALLVSCYGCLTNDRSPLALLRFDFCRCLRRNRQKQECQQGKSPRCAALSYVSGRFCRRNLARRFSITSGSSLSIWPSSVLANLSARNSSSNFAWIACVSRCSARCITSVMNQVARVATECQSKDAGSAIAQMAA
jgi:hypothetical protein